MERLQHRLRVSELVLGGREREGEIEIPLLRMAILLVFVMYEAQQIEIFFNNLFKIMQFTSGSVYKLYIIHLIRQQQNL